MIRRQIALELGTVVPIIRLRDNIQLNPNQYIIKIKGVQVTEGEILFDHYMAMNPGYVEEEITGIPTFEPSFHLPAIWITEAQRERAESLGYTVVDAPSIIATHLTEVIRSHIAELLTRQDVQNLVNNLKESNPVLVDELTPKLLGLGEIQKVLQNLLREGISIRDLLSIFESLARSCTDIQNTDVLTEYVRQSLKRAISSKYFPSNETTSVITLDPKVEQGDHVFGQADRAGCISDDGPGENKSNYGFRADKKPRNSKASERIRSLLHRQLCIFLKNSQKIISKI